MKKLVPCTVWELEALVLHEAVVATPARERRAFMETVEQAEALVGITRRRRLNEARVYNDIELAEVFRVIDTNLCVPWKDNAGNLIEGDESCVPTCGQDARDDGVDMNVESRIYLCCPS